MEVGIINEKEQNREQEKRWETIEKEFEKVGLKVTSYLRCVKNPKKSYWTGYNDAHINQITQTEYLLKIYDAILIPKYKKILEISKIK